MIDFASTLTFADLHVYLKAIGPHGPLHSAQDLCDRPNPTNDPKVKLAKLFTQGVAPLLISDYSLATIAKVLEKPSVDDETEELSWVPFSEEDAERSAESVSDLVLSTNGWVLPDEYAAEGCRIADDLLPAHLKGTKKGQVDFEDLMVIGACIASVNYLREQGVAEEDCKVILVSDDGGINNCRNLLVRHGVCVLGVTAYSRAVSDQVAQAA